MCMSYFLKATSASLLPLLFIPSLLSLSLPVLYYLPSPLLPHLALLCSEIGRKMYPPLWNAPSIPLIVREMALSFSRGVAIWRTLEHLESDSPVRDINVTQKRKYSAWISDLISYFIFLSHLATCLFPSSWFMITEVGLIGGLLSKPLCVCSHQSGSWKEPSFECCRSQTITRWWHVSLSDAGPRDSQEDHRMENI